MEQSFKTKAIEEFESRSDEKTAKRARRESEDSTEDEATDVKRPTLVEKRVVRRSDLKRVLGPESIG